jgi:hypothetical protein
MHDRRVAAAHVIICALGAALVAVGAGVFAACSSSSSGAKAGDASSEGTSSDGGAGDALCVAYDASGLDGAAVAAGHQQAMLFRCQHCHQPMGGMGVLTLQGNDNNVGDGGVVAYAPNLTPDPATGLGCWTDPQIQRAILDGTDNEGVTLCVMPQFAQQGMDAGTAAEIVQFLRSLPTVVHQVPDTNCPSDGGAD